jgi:hypothetical protein
MLLSFLVSLNNQFLEMAPASLPLLKTLQKIHGDQSVTGKHNLTHISVFLLTSPFLELYLLISKQHTDVEMKGTLC